MTSPHLNASWVWGKVSMFRSLHPKQGCTSRALSWSLLNKDVLHPLSQKSHQLSPPGTLQDWDAVTVLISSLTKREAEAQRFEGTCSRSHREEAASSSPEPGLALGPKLRTITHVALRTALSSLLGSGEPPNLPFSPSNSSSPCGALSWRTPPPPP